MCFIAIDSVFETIVYEYFKTNFYFISFNVSLKFLFNIFILILRKLKVQNK